MNHHTKYLGHRSFHLKVAICVRAQTNSDPTDCTTWTTKWLLTSAHKMVIKEVCMCEKMVQNLQIITGCVVASVVLMATKFVNGKWQILTPTESILLN